MIKQLNQYTFNKISSKMAAEFGTIKKGFEEQHSMLLMPMEGNLLKLHRQDERRNGRRAIEAIHICLLMIDGYLNNVEYDFSKYMTDENRDFVTGILMSFDPFTNEEVMAIIGQTYDVKSSEDLRLYFKEPIMCLLRIENSIETWIRDRGVNGYFLILEEYIGKTVKNDTEMNYSVCIKE